MPNNLALLKRHPSTCPVLGCDCDHPGGRDPRRGRLRRAALNDDVLRGIAGSGGARQPEADEASLASRATSAHTVIPTPHGRARMGERAVSVKELQTAKKYGTITRARNGRDGAVRWKIEHNGIVYITDRTQKLVITTYHQIPSGSHPPAVGQAKRGEGLTSLFDDELFNEHREGARAVRQVSSEPRG